MDQDARVAELETRLDDFDPAEREAALEALMALVEAGTLRLPDPRPRVNLHAHSFHSYNALGYSPTHLVWRARREGLRAVGLVDFDVLDGIAEFFRAGVRAGIPTTAGMETRVYVPERADQEINSPGEPGVAYHMAAGLVPTELEDPQARDFADRLRTGARRRNEDVVTRVNEALDPVRLDYEADVLPLSPSGTPTERHLCAAYEAKAEAVYPDRAERARFWADRLGLGAAKAETLLDDSRSLQATIRARTMKCGGVGYQAPTPTTFPLWRDVDRFARTLGGIPTLTWLDGTSPAEADIEALMDLEMSDGVAAMNIIPDRNWNLDDAEARKVKVANLHAVVRLAEKRGLPVHVGTEMNAPGQPFVDDFDAPELAPVVETFRRGADIFLGHTAATLTEKGGYLDPAVETRFASVAEKNAHFALLGRAWQPRAVG